LTRGERLSLQMLDAWKHKNISPNEFRKCLSSDLDFLKTCEDVISEEENKMKKEQQVKELMNNMMRT